LKFRQLIKKKKSQNKKVKEQKQVMLLDTALKKLIELQIAIIDENKYKYSPCFEQTAKEIIESPPGKIKQAKFAKEVGHKLIPQLIAIASHKPTRRDIENMITGYICLKIHIEEHSLEVDKKIIPDLAYAIWYLNDNNPTIEEVEEWNSTSHN